MSTRKAAGARAGVALLGVIAALAVTWLGGGAAWASGSASVLVLDEHLALEIRQTFRKSLPSGRASGYFEGVRQTFLGKARAILPRLAKVVRRFRRKMRALRAVSATLPKAYCHRGDSCPPKVERYPALVPMPQLLRRKGDRTAYIVYLALRRALSKRQVTRLSKALQRALDKEPGSSDKGAKYSRVSELSKRHPLFSLRFRMTYHTDKPAAERARLQRRMALVIKRVAARIGKISRASGCAVTPHKASLPYFSRRAPKLPARDTVSFDNGLIMGALQIGLAKVPDKDKYSEFVSALSKAATRALVSGK